MPKKRLFLFTLMFLMLLASGCFVPQYLYPQPDISAITTGDEEAAVQILIASRKSAFKQAVIDQIVIHFADQSMSFRLIGLDQLNTQNTESYQAIVLINTCIAWNVDPAVRKFLKSHKDQNRIIVLTTAGDPDWEAQSDHENVHTISSASVLANASGIAADIIAQMNILLQD